VKGEEAKDYHRGRRGGAVSGGKLRILAARFCVLRRGRLWKVAGAVEDGERRIFGEAMIGLGELAEEEGGTFGGGNEA
jgi:hypothetical protein